MKLHTSTEYYHINTTYKCIFARFFFTVNHWYILLSNCDLAIRYLSPSYKIVGRYEKLQFLIQVTLLFRALLSWFYYQISNHRHLIYISYVLCTSLDILFCLLIQSLYRLPCHSLSEASLKVLVIDFCKNQIRLVIFEWGLTTILNNYEYIVFDLFKIINQNEFERSLPCSIEQRQIHD